MNRYLPNLKAKLQKQMTFRNKSSAMREINYQKNYNPSTYKWLVNKNIIVGGNEVSVKELIKRKITKKKASPRQNYLKQALRNAGF